MQKSKWSILSYIVSVLAITVLTLAYYGKGKLHLIDYDIAGYYAYLPATFIYKDLKELDWRDSIIERYNINGLDNCAPTRVSGAKVIKYPVGMSVSYLPGFLTAHIYALNTNHLADGFSTPYQIGLIIIGWLYMLIALWYLRKLLSIYFEDWIVGLTIILVALGTNYYIYAGSQTMMSHSFLFMLFALVIYHTIVWYKSYGWFRIVFIGILLGLIAITRPTEILLTLLVFFWGISNAKELKARYKLLVQFKLQFILATIAALCVISIQLIYWKYSSGDWIVYSYKGEGFSWDGRYLKECFFGFRKGWLIYTPIMILGIIGLYYLNKSDSTKSIAKPIILFLIISTYIIFSWDNYWYGGGFGQRAMISSYVLFALGIAAFLKRLQNSPRIIQGLSTLFIVFCIWLNIFQTFQAQIWGGFETSYMSKKYYLQIFGAKDIHPDWKTFLDNSDAVLGKVDLSEALFEEDFNTHLGSNDRLYKNSNTFMLNKKGLFTLLDTTIRGVKKGDRFRAQIVTAGVHRIWNRNHMSNLHVQLLADGKVVSDQSARIQDVARDGTWKTFYVDIKARQNNIDQIKVLAWCNKVENVVYIDELKIYKIK